MFVIWSDEEKPIQREKKGQESQIHRRNQKGGLIIPSNETPGKECWGEM